MAVLAIIAAVQLAFASEIVETAWPGIDLDIDTWAVPHFRQVYFVFHLEVALVLLGYWLFVATMGRGEVLGIWSADLFMAMSGLTFASSVAATSLVSDPIEVLMQLCPELGLENDHPKFGFGRARTECVAFGEKAVLALALGIPTVLLLISALLRVSISRKRAARGRSTDI